MSQKGSELRAYQIALQLGFTIAIPLVLLALLGRILDRALGTSPWLLLTGIFLSILVSSWLVYLKAVKLMAEVMKEDRDEKQKDEQAKH